MSVRRPARVSGAVEDPKVNRLVDVLRVGMRLRQPAVGAPTGVKLDRNGQVVYTDDERDLLLAVPNEADLPTALQREAWRKVRGLPVESEQDLLTDANRPMPKELVELSDYEDEADEPSPMIRKQGKKKKAKASRVVQSSSDEDDGPVFRARKAARAAKAAKAREEARAKAAAEAAAVAARELEAQAERERAQRAAEAQAAKAKAEAQAKEQAEARALADQMNARLAEAEARSKAASPGAGSSSTDSDDYDVELVDEPNEGAVTVDEAFAEFKKAWEAQDYTAIWHRVIPALTDDETEALFPRVRNLSDIPKLGEAMKGPIKVGVYRFNKKSITEPQRKAMPTCVDLLMKQDNFYFHEPDALIAGGNEFSKWFKQTWRFQSWFVDGKKSRGYRSNHQGLMFDAGSKSWKMPCTFVTHTPAAFGPNPNCKLEHVPFNWTCAYRWIKAAEAANAVLNAGSAVPKTLLKEGGPQDKPTGVIGYDTILPVPDWARTLLPNVKSWSSANFPSLEEDGKLRFSRGGQTCAAAECVLKHCTKALPELFKSVATTEFEERRMFDFEDFLRDPSKNLALAAWANHARIVYKDSATRVITVYDPWKQRVVIQSQLWLTSAAKATGYSVVFQAREKDQGAEGSCQLQATMRVLMAAVHGKDAITAKINAEENRHLLIFPVITQLLYTKCRKSRR